MCLRRLALLVLSGIALVGCSTQSDTRLYLIDLGPDGLSPQRPAKTEILIERGRRQYDATWLLRHDYRTDSLSVRLAIKIHRQGLPMWQDTVTFRLADRPGRWLRPRVSMQEVEVPMPQPLSLTYTGRYIVEIVPVGDVRIEGITTIGLQLTARQ